VVLSDRSGLELVDELLSRRPELRVLLSSGYLDDKSQGSIIRQKGFQFLHKPYGVPDLFRIVGELMKDRSAR